MLGDRDSVLYSHALTPPPPPPARTIPSAPDGRRKPGTLVRLHQQGPNSGVNEHDDVVENQFSNQIGSSQSSSSDPRTKDHDPTQLPQFWQNPMQQSITPRAHSPFSSIPAWARLAPFFPFPADLQDNKHAPAHLVPTLEGRTARFGVPTLDTDSDVSLQGGPLQCAMIESRKEMMLWRGPKAEGQDEEEEYELVEVPQEQQEQHEWDNEQDEQEEDEEDEQEEQLEDGPSQAVTKEKRDTHDEQGKWHAGDGNEQPYLTFGRPVEAQEFLEFDIQNLHHNPPPPPPPEVEDDQDELKDAVSVQNPEASMNQNTSVASSSGESMRFRFGSSLPQSSTQNGHPASTSSFADTSSYSSHHGAGGSTLHNHGRLYKGEQRSGATLQLPTGDLWFLPKRGPGAMTGMGGQTYVPCLVIEKPDRPEGSNGPHVLPLFPAGVLQHQNSVVAS
eukprot:gnl/MRDRNA2_/MRDRNA2_77510_c0_seq2.p1 gnl/MRDRNA2_/MRDRNA2_77510_c0~~gnl/MRDRNA2_/MRDRNA2_77510_c0_seq2.p1  ORF type:complete len:446 (+),score=83.33 gnl/MRDRNA2_/MRDRNA2_77510_c0_seq2:1202-2539(+)